MVTSSMTSSGIPVSHSRVYVPAGVIGHTLHWSRLRDNSTWRYSAARAQSNHAVRVRVQLLWVELAKYSLSGWVSRLRIMRAWVSPTFSRMLTLAVLFGVDIANKSTCDQIPCWTFPASLYFVFNLKIHFGVNITSKSTCDLESLMSIPCFALRMPTGTCIPFHCSRRHPLFCF